MACFSAVPDPPQLPQEPELPVKVAQQEAELQNQAGWSPGARPFHSLNLHFFSYKPKDWVLWSSHCWHLAIHLVIIVSQAYMRGLEVTSQEPSSTSTLKQIDC